MITLNWECHFQSFFSPQVISLQLLQNVLSLILKSKILKFFIIAGDKNSGRLVAQAA